MIGSLDDWWLLQIILVYLYVSDCVLWVNTRSVIIERTRRGCRWRWPLYDLSVGGHAPVLLNPLTPWRQVHVIEALPVTMTTDAVVICPMHNLRRSPEVADTQVGTLGWNDLRGVWSEGDRVFLKRSVPIPLGTVQGAAKMADHLRSLWRADHADRDRMLDALADDRCDTDCILALSNGDHGTERELRFASAALLVSLYGVLPVAIGVLPVLIPWVFAIAGLCWMILLARFASTARGDPRRWRHILNMLFMPTSAIRVITHLSRDRLMDFDPAAVVLALPIERSSTEVTGLILRDLLWPVRTGHEPIDRQLDSARVRLLKRLRDRFDDLDTRVEAPYPDSGCVAYCPRCQMQYVIDVRECCNCRGVRLRLWGTAHKV